MSILFSLITEYSVSYYCICYCISTVFLVVSIIVLFLIVENKLSFYLSTYCITLSICVCHNYHV